MRIFARSSVSPTTAGEAVDRPCHAGHRRDGQQDRLRRPGAGRVEAERDAVVVSAAGTTSVNSSTSSTATPARAGPSVPSACATNARDRIGPERRRERQADPLPALGGLGVWERLGGELDRRRARRTPCPAQARGEQHVGEPSDAGVRTRPVRLKPGLERGACAAERGEHGAGPRRDRVGGERGREGGRATGAATSGSTGKPSPNRADGSSGAASAAAAEAAVAASRSAIERALSGAPARGRRPARGRSRRARRARRATRLSSRRRARRDAGESATTALASCRGRRRGASGGRPSSTSGSRGSGACRGSPVRRRRRPLITPPRSCGRARSRPVPVRAPGRAARAALRRRPAAARVAGAARSTRRPVARAPESARVAQHAGARAARSTRSSAPRPSAASWTSDRGRRRRHRRNVDGASPGSPSRCPAQAATRGSAWARMPSVGQPGAAGTSAASTTSDARA